MTPTRLDIAALDLTRHGVIEASAGTGKTYTIENLVLRLVADEGVAPEEILVVTFTEKATGELRTRLRLTLERALKDYPERRATLQPALDHFDQLPIFTIHGFCQRLLQEYALEQGQDFRTGVVDDGELLEIVLREVQRKDWRRLFGKHLYDTLEQSHYTRDKAADWENRLLQVAQKYKPRCGHRLRPVPAERWWEHVGNPDHNPAGQLAITTIGLMQQHLHEYKRQRGLLSFDDMIALVEENLDPERNPDADALLNTLRARYRFGIVDEFQDTDPLQWRIFRRIFLEGGTSRLFVVGDPKQAIFGFRGADLPTYLTAARTMKDEFDACEYPLQINWRSEPDLLEALNCLFGEGEWFPKATGIAYREVGAPDDAERPVKIVGEDRTGRAALTFVDLRHVDRLKACQKPFARFVVNEIRRLLSPGGEPLLAFEQRGQTKPLELSDICILVFKRNEAEPVLTALRQAGIPFSFYKQSGLWQSEEAVQIEALLRALARPDERASFRMALLTCFFRIRPAELAQAGELPARHPARTLYQRWLVHAEKRHWSALFASLLEETGVLLRGAGDPDAERRNATLRHILNTLEQVGHGEDRDLLGLLDWIREKRLRRDPGDADIHPVETDRPRVKIMTVHASKGLEFPVVFLAGGFTHKHQTNPCIYRDDTGRLVIDLNADQQAEQAMKEDTVAEQRRLLYVALTRAMLKLYVPLVAVGSKARATAGPVGTVLLPAWQASNPDKLGATIADVIPPEITAPLPRLAAEPPAPRLLPAPPFTCEGPLFPTLDANLARRRIVVRSFSSMSRQHLASLGDGSSYGDMPARALDESASPAETDDPLRGAAFGELVHTVLERIDYAEVARTAVPDELLRAGTPANALIEQTVRDNLDALRARMPPEELETHCRTQVAALVWHALQTPLHEAGGPLCRVSAADRLHEVEFYYPEVLDGPPPADHHWEEGFVMGYIDLVFRRGSRYFLVDWKTNLLAGYERAALERCMDEANYHRQYRLYLQALERWLRRVHGRAFDFARHLGGVYYLFVRGLNGRDESAGVYYHKPTHADLDLRAALAR